MNIFLKIVAIVILTTVYSLSQAQVSVGLKTGVNFANMADESTDQAFIGDAISKPRIGLNIALLLHFKFGDSPFGLQIEPGYSQRGVKVATNETSTNNSITYRSTEKVTLKADYLELPVLFKFSPQFGPVEGIFSLGPELRFLTKGMSYNYEYKDYENGELAYSSSGEETVIWDGNDDPGKLDLGVVAGVGVAIPLGNLKIFAEGRYHYGLPFINSSSTEFGTGLDTVTTIHKLSNRGVSANIGILYTLGGN